MTDQFDKPIRLSIYSVPSHFPVVRAAIEKACQQLGFDQRASGDVMLSTDEALTNILRHAYHGANDQLIELELAVTGSDSDNALRISIRDYGQAVDRKEIRSRDLDDVRPGGLGVHIMSKCMDEVQYTHPEGGGTLLIMDKTIPHKKHKVS